MHKNHEYVGEVVALGSEGEGVISHEGCTAFVPFCLVGEKISFKALKVNGNIAYGKLTEVHTLSNNRVAPVCAVYEKCGGCQLQHMNYQSQLDFKRQIVSGCLKKIGGLDAEVQSTVPSEKQYYYRNKLALPVGVNENGENVIGFFAPRSHRIVPVTDCALQQPWAKEVISALYKFMSESRLGGYDETSGKGIIRHIVGRQIKNKYIITVVATKRVELTLFAEMLDKVLSDFTLLLNVNTAKTNVIFGNEWHICRGEGFFASEDCGIKFKAGANTFLQINDDVRTKLYERTVKEAAQKGAAAIDLYSGGGMLTAMLAKECGKAYGIEIVKEAVVCADELKEMNGLSEKMINICGKVEDEIDKVFEETAGSKRVIVCDPPRKGMERSVVKAILNCSADKVVLISCNPATLARDLGLLCGSLIEKDGQLLKNPEFAQEGLPGYYKIQSVIPHDMFPQTKHVETLVLLQRK